MVFTFYKPLYSKIKMSHIKHCVLTLGVGITVVSLLPTKTPNTQLFMHTFALTYMHTYSVYISCPIFQRCK